MLTLVGSESSLLYSNANVPKRSLESINTRDHIGGTCVLVDEDLDVQNFDIDDLVKVFDRVCYVWTVGVEENKLVKYIESKYSDKCSCQFAPTLESITSATILELCNDSSSSNKVSTTICNLSNDELLNKLVEFIVAIDTQDKHSIEANFTAYFDMYPSMLSKVKDRLSELEGLRKMATAKEKSVVQLQSRVDSLETTIQKLSESGKNCEDSIEILTTERDQALVEVEKLNSELSTCREGLIDATKLLNDMKHNLKEKQSGLERATEELSSFRTKFELASKEKHSLVDTINKMRTVSEDSTVSMVNLGEVSKVFYVKYISQIPYLISCIQKYQKLTFGQSKGAISVGVVLVSPKGSSVYDKYLDAEETNRVSSGGTYTNCNKTFYVSDGYNMYIKDYLAACKCQIVFILDLTFSDNVYLKAPGVEMLYTVNSAEDIERFRLSPNACISQRHIPGVRIELPFYGDIDSELGGNIITRLKTDVFINFDTLWR